MEKIGLFFGSDTGNTEAISYNIQKKLGKDSVIVQDIAKSTKEDIEVFDFLIFGIPTWYYGEAQCDWDDFFPEFEKIDFSGKIIAIFGCGDQEDYSEYFLDAMGQVGDIVLSNGGIIVGHTSTDGYYFDDSKALINENTFIGLGIDEDRQPELTEHRIEDWVKQLQKEMHLNDI